MTPDNTNDTKCANAPGADRVSTTAGARPAHPNVDCSTSVNAVLARYPSTGPVFHRFGLDTCCGGRLSVADAARAADVDAETLCGALEEVIAA